MADEAPACHRKNAENSSQSFSRKPRTCGLNSGMRFLAILALVVGIYLIFVRAKSTPVPDATPGLPAAASAQPEQKTNFLKQPIDRAREVLKANEKRTSEGF